MSNIGKVFIGALLVIIGYVALSLAVLSILALCLQFLIPGATAGAFTPGFLQCVSITALGCVAAGILALPHNRNN